MPTAYITAPLTTRGIQKTGRLYGKITSRDYIRNLEAIAEIIREAGYQVILPHKSAYEWGDSAYSPKALVRRAFDTLQSCDLLVAWPAESRGANVLIGWASVLRKKIIILLDENDTLSVVHAGLDSLTKIQIIRYKDFTDLEEKLRQALQNIKSE